MKFRQKLLTLTVSTMIKATPQIAFKGKAGVNSPSAFNNSMVRPVRSKPVENLVLDVAKDGPRVRGDGGIFNDFSIGVHSWISQVKSCVG